MAVRVICGDVREKLAELPAGSVQCCVTSPPYFGLRDYGVAGQIGLEPTLAEYVAAMVDVFRDVRRVLRDDGTVWLNLGDSYSASQSASCGVSPRSTLTGGGGRYREGSKHEAQFMASKPVPRIRELKPKDLMMVPARVALALQDDGWWLRSDIIWAKKNCMPESVTDRPTSSHEHIFLLTKSARYFYDADAVREPHTSDAIAINWRDKDYDQSFLAAKQLHGVKGRPSGVAGMPEGGRNQRNVWHLATEPFSEAHFATFPTEIPRRCIKAGSREGDTVLDPFLGSGTTLMVADQLGRNGIGIELNPEYAEMAKRRITNDAPLFVSVAD